MIAVQKKSGKRHLIHPDGLATRCGRILYRPNWRLEDADADCDCGNCRANLEAERIPVERIAWYTRQHIHNLQKHGNTKEGFHITSDMPDDERRKREARARSRIMNAAGRAGLQVTTHVKVGNAGPYIEGIVKETT